MQKAGEADEADQPQNSNIEPAERGDRSEGEHIGVRGSPERGISSLGALVVGLPGVKNSSRHVAVRAWPCPGWPGQEAMAEGRGRRPWPKTIAEGHGRRPWQRALAEGHG